MAGNYSLWKDNNAYLTMDDITNKMGEIEMEMIAHTDAVIFLTTDSVIIEQQFSEKYPNRVVMANYLPQTLTGKQSTEAGLMRVVIELFILGKSNSLFLTSKSTLSRVALAMNSMNPKVQYFWLCLFCNQCIWFGFGWLIQLSLKWLQTVSVLQWLIIEYFATLFHITSLYFFQRIDYKRLIN